MCPKCNGKKIVLVESGFGFKVEARCDECNGSGKNRKTATCKTCNDAKTIVAGTSGIKMEIDCPDCNATTVV